MSHKVTLKLKLDKKKFAKAACKRLGLTFEEGPVRKTFYGGTTAQGDYAVKLKGWKYPIVVKGDEVQFDNYNGNWGKQEELDKFTQAYGIEAAKEKARNYGSVQEITLKDGTVRIEATW